MEDLDHLVWMILSHPNQNGLPYRSTDYAIGQARDPECLLPCSASSDDSTPSISSTPPMALPPPIARPSPVAKAATLPHHLTAARKASTPWISSSVLPPIDSPKP
jgi:hypothetical protein